MSQQSRSVWSHRLVILCLGLVAFSFTLFAIQSGDVLMYLALARDFVFAGEWKYTDPYLYSLANAPLIWTHEYLSFAVFSWAHAFFSWPGLIMLKALVWGAIFVITLRAEPRAMTVSWVWMGLWLLAVLAGSFRFIERSSMFSDLVYVWLFAYLLGRDKLDRWMILTLTPVFLLWPQFHPGFPVGLALLFMWSAYHTVKTRSVVWWHNVWLLLPVLVICIHPDGVNALIYPFQFSLNEASVFKKHNFEWMPAYSRLFRSAHETLAFWLLAALSVWLIAREKAWLTLRAIFALFAVYMAVSAVRFIPWASFALLICVKPWARFHYLRAVPKPYQAVVVSLLLILLSVKNIVYGYNASSGERLPGWSLDPKFFPVRTVDFLEKNRIAGNLYNSHDFGSFLVFRGILPIFHHGFVTDMKFYENDVMGLFRGQARFLELAAKYNWTMLLVEKYGPYRYFYQILAPLPQWKIVAEDEASYLIYRFDR